MVIPIEILMGAYRKHYLKYAKKKSRKIDQKKSFKKVAKYYLFLCVMIAVLPVLSIANDKEESLLVEWIKRNSKDHMFRDETSVQVSSTNYLYPEIRINPSALVTTERRNGDSLDLKVKNLIGDSREPLWTKTFSDHKPVRNTIENSEFENDYVPLENIGDLVDENEQTLEVDRPNPYRSSNLKKKAFNHKLYRVKNGESIWMIARKNKITIDSIITLNGIKTPHLLKYGTVLKIPQISGVYHQVQKNDSLFSITKKYRTSVEKIKEYNEINGFLSPGDFIFLPQVTLPKVERDYLFGNLFVMPVSGKISSKYGVRFHPIKRKKLFHTGIDIAQNYLSKVKAATSGVVVKAGYYGNYGNMIVIKHPYHYQTTYAHLEKIWVKKGQKLKKGQYIGLVGNSGLSTGPHLHFEVAHKGKFINPLRFIKL